MNYQTKNGAVEAARELNLQPGSCTAYAVQDENGIYTVIRGSAIRWVQNHPDRKLL